MDLVRSIVGACAVLSLSACSVLGVGANTAGVKIVGKQQYCGTPSQSSEIHYFASQAAFDNWVQYRDVGDWQETVSSPGLVVVEMGQRPTGGYKLHLDPNQTGLEDDVLKIGFDWRAPRLDAAVSQALTSQCVAVALPTGTYKKVEVLDQLGNKRGSFSVER